MAKRSRKSRKSTTRTSSRPVQSVAKPAASRTQVTVDFAKEYFYVYDDMRTMLILTVLMALVMFGLSFVL